MYYNFNLCPTNCCNPCNFNYYGVVQTPYPNLYWRPTALDPSCFLAQYRRSCCGKKSRHCDCDSSSSCSSRSSSSSCSVSDSSSSCSVSSTSDFKDSCSSKSKSSTCISYKGKSKKYHFKHSK